MMRESASEYAPYVKHARQSSAARQRDAVGRWERAWQHARVVAEHLRRVYAPRRIIAFGSLVHPELFDARSDLDLAVEGIAWPDYLRAWNEADALSPNFSVDLIDISTVSDLMRQRIEEEGRPL